METAKNVFAFLGEMWTVSILLVAAYVAAKEIRTRKREKIRAEESRRKKKGMLEETLSIMNQGRYMVNGKEVKLTFSPAEMEISKVYLPRDIEAIQANPAMKPAKGSKKCAYGCFNEDSFTHALEMDSHGNAKAKPVLVLNLANPVNPGGGARDGASAQEEDLCRKSSLLVALESAAAGRYYEYNRAMKTYMGSDAVMVHPNVEVIRSADGSLLEDTATVSVMTCAAPMLRNGMEGKTYKEYEGMLRHRITGMLKVAASLGYRRLVLGAFGCGAFGNDAKVVSDAFRDAIKGFSLGGVPGSRLFDQIDFAVLDRTAGKYNYNEFMRNFGDFSSEDEILKAVDTVCMNCPKDTLNDKRCCEKCAVRMLVDSLTD